MTFGKLKFYDNDVKSNKDKKEIFNEKLVEYNAKTAAQIKDPYGDDYEDFRKLPKKDRNRVHNRHIRQNTDGRTLWLRRLVAILGKVFIYALLITLGYLILYPILDMISTAATHPAELGSPTSIWIPARTSIEFFTMAYRGLNYSVTLPYTIMTVGIQVLLQMISAMLAGYAFARLDFKGKGLLFALVILQIIVPPQAISLPQYLNFRNFDIFGIFRAITGEPLNLIGQPTALYILAATGQGLKGAIFIFIFRQGFRALPKELEESAYIDGAGYARTFLGIVLPNAGSTILTASILSAVWNWNDSYFISLFAGTDPNQRHLMVKLNAATGNMEQTVGGLARALPPELVSQFELLLRNPLYQQAVAQTMSLLAILPLIVFYIIVQRWFIQSTERSGIVG